MLQLFLQKITEEERDAEVEWLAGMIKLWLDEEWMYQEPHAALGRQAAAKITDERINGCNDVTQLVMSVASDLLTFDFYDTFVNGFEVANKCSEMLMMREGYEVCCVSKEDLTRIERYEAMKAAGEL